MNKALILSDSHGLTNELNEIKQRHQLQYMIHCGDSELDMDAPEMEGFVKVGGNTDFDARYPEEEVVDLEGLKILIVHGHLHGVKSSLATLSYRADEVNAPVACYGHTHIADARKLDNTLFINPGSIRLPRERMEKTYCIIEWDDEFQMEINYYTVDGDKISDLSSQIKL